MRLGKPAPWVVLAVTAALAGCGDDGGAPQGEGSTGAASSSTTGGGETTAPGTTTSPASSSSTSAAESSSSTGGDAESSSSGPSTTSGSEDTGTSTGTLDGVTLSGVVSDFASGDPVPEIDVCVFEQPGIPCAITDDAGSYSLMGVPEAEGAIEFTGSNRFPSLFWGAGPTEDDVLDYRLLSSIAAAVLANALDQEIDDSLGHLALAVTDADNTLLTGVSFTMEPSSGALGYITPTGIDPMLTETSQIGFAGWVNVDVGEVEITASHPTLDCVPGPGALIGSTPDALRIDVTAGYLGSTFPFVCS